MKKHTKIVMDFFGAGEQDVLLCEYCYREVATEVHHKISKGMGGNKNLDYIENLICLCRGCHQRAHAEPEFNEALDGENLPLRKWKMNNALFGEMK